MVFASKKKKGFYYIDGELNIEGKRKHYHKESIKDNNFKSKKWCEEEEQKLIDKIKFTFVPSKLTKVKQTEDKPENTSKTVSKKGKETKCKKGCPLLGKEKRVFYGFTIEPSTKRIIENYCYDKGISMSSFVAQACLKVIQNERD